MAQQETQSVAVSSVDLLPGQIAELGKRMDRLENRMDKLEGRLDDTRRELNARIDKVDERIEKLADKIDNLRCDMNTSSNHINVANISTIGIALAVIYFVATH